MFRIILFLVCAINASASAAKSKDCVASMQTYQQSISKDAKPLPASAFKGINKRWNVERILKHLGPASRDIGSGVHILEWDVSDGRVFSVSTASLCGKPMKVGFYPAPRKGLTQ